MFGVEDILGSIQENKLADLIIIDQNLFEINPKNIHKTKVDIVILNGEIVFNNKNDFDKNI